MAKVKDKKVEEIVDTTEQRKKQIEEAVKKVKLTKIFNEKAERYTFSKVGDLLNLPNLISVQLDSYNWFITEGLTEVLRDISPIQDYNGNLILEFFGHRLEDTPKYGLEESRDRNTTYSKRLYVNVRLINKETGEIKEQEIFLGDFPIMTESGTFLINGAERVVVSQLVRSPGCYFINVDSNSKYKTTPLYNATIMPIRGAWIEFETETAGTVFTRIDRTRKLPATTLLRALGVETIEEMVEIFGEDEALVKTVEKDQIETQNEALIEIYKKLRPGELPTIDAAKTLFDQLFFNVRRYDLSRVGRFKYDQKLSLASRINKQVLAENIIDKETGELVFEAGKKLKYAEALQIQNMGINRVKIKFKGKEIVVLGNNTVDLEAFVSEEVKEESGIKERVNYTELLKVLDKVEKDKDLNLVQELKKNRSKLVSEHVTKEDILSTFNYILNLNHGLYKIDNIDHLGNRRIRSVGELLQNQFRIGLTRLERVVRERMTIKDLDTVTPQTLINTKPITSVVREFFGSSQLSQFMEQTNPLSELTHKRRVSSLGPGGLSRDRAGFEVRDIHYTHYGRLCPVESPEGPNVGLILSLSGFARINEYGFVETPYRKIDPVTKKITDEVVYMSSDMEDNFVICQATEPVTKDGKLKNDRVRARYLDEIKEMDKDEIDYMDVSPKQIASIATAMIPFFETDDARRTLMGANMQRQAVPLLRTDSPMVGTGMEYRAAKDSGEVINCLADGHVHKLTGTEIIVKGDDGKIYTHTLRKFKRTNASTCINQKPIVKEGEKVYKNQIIADGMATDKGEMALGKNAVVAFANWEGYTFEDAILISDKLVKEDTYTSIHIEQYDFESRDTKLRTRRNNKRNT